MIKARVLLAIFVSTIVLSALHRHESVSTVAADCTECAHHVHHYHLATATTGIHDCLLCQFITLNYIARQSHCYRADNTETTTLGYALLNLSAGTSLMIKKKKVADLCISADNLFDKAYQNHLSRLKYADINHATGRMGVYNQGFNICLKATMYLNL